MTFARRCLCAFCFIFLLASVAPRLGPGPQVLPRVLAQSAPAVATTTATPAEAKQAYALPPEKLAKAITLSHIRLALDILGSIWGLAVLWLLLATHAAVNLATWTQRILSRRWLQGLLFFAAFFVITTLASLPLDAVGHMVSRHYAISVQGWGSWLGDQAKGLGLTLAFGPFILLLFNLIVRVSRRRYWVWLWLITLPLIVFSVFVGPLFDPMFNKFEPLTNTHAALVQKLEGVVARTGTNIPPERMFLMKASAKSNGLNAYVTGIGATKRFVMWDTATDRLPDDEVLFIFGHESGHYVLNHIPKTLAGISAALFFVFWGCAAFSEWMVGKFGARWQIDSLASRSGFLILLLSLSLAGFVLAPASNTLSRHFEHQADVYGQEAIHGIVADPQKVAVSGFNHLGEAWLEDPAPNAFVEFWTYNHPSVKNRANFALHYNPWADGGHGEFFDK